MDENREKRKRLRAVLSFVLMAVLLMVLFFAAINIGSLKVSFGELMRGLFVERIDEVVEKEEEPKEEKPKKAKAGMAGE